MNLELIGNLVRLRYKLLWAKTRTRNGKIALFFSGYLLLVMVLFLLSLGGFSAGVTFVRSGKGTLVAAAVLTGIGLQGLLSTVVLGFGISTIFADTELRRYPIKARERRLVRHLIGILDPFWFLFLALELGLAFGLYLFGAGSFWMGLIAVILFFIANYLAARLLALLVDRLVARKGGSIVLLASVISLGFLPSLLQPVLHKNSPVVVAAAHIFHYTPPYVAAVAMTHFDLSAVSGIAVLLAWLLALAAALVAIERRPPKIRAAQATSVSWNSPFDRLGALFPERYAPLVAHWLRFYFRNNRFRTIYPLALPLAAFLLFFFGKQAGPHSTFPASLSAFLILGCIGTAQFAVNQFGYVSGGFRRFLLLPTDPAAAFRAGSFTFMMLSAVLIPVAALLWCLFAPAPFDARALVMLVGASVFSLFFFHALGLWTSLLAPRRGNYATAFGNDLSFAANVVVIAGMLIMLFAPRLLAKPWPAAVSPAFWWTTPSAAALAAAFYFVSLRTTTTVFRVRREQLLAIVEGRS